MHKDWKKINTTEQLAKSLAANCLADDALLADIKDVIARAGELAVAELEAQSDEAAAWMTANDWGSDLLITTTPSVRDLWIYDSRKVTPLYLRAPQKKSSSDVDVLRRIADRGMNLAHEQSPQFVDLFQHMLDEIQRIGQAKQAVPEGWKLVPIEPTAEMLNSAKQRDCDGMPASYTAIYQTMIAAAPSP
jgi:hypothetical protein